MLYAIQMFWDGKSHHPVKARINTNDEQSYHSVEIEQNGSAATRIFVRDAESAKRLADVINEIGAVPAAQRAA